MQADNRLPRRLIAVQATLDESVDLVRLRQ
jgi:hypothetical protein